MNDVSNNDSAKPDERRRAHRAHVAGHAPHGGLDPSVRTLEAQSQYALIWGASGFPDDYAGPEVVVYGHRNNALLNHEKWPLPAMTDVTIGVDTISHGVLTAVRMPDRRIFQSARHRARRSGP